MRKALFTLIFLGLLAPVLQAQPKKNKNKDKDAAVIFQPDERRVIGDYFSNTSNLPPGLAKRGGNLPPGLQKHIQRNGQLPPGLQKRLVAFPDDLNRRLPAIPSIFRRGLIGDRAVIYDPRSMMILDMIDIFSGLRR
jgi:hypothetical protein